MPSVKELIAQREQEKAAKAQPTVTTAPTPAPVAAPKSKPVAKSIDVAAVTRTLPPVASRIVTPSVTAKPERASVALARDQGIVRAQLAKSATATSGVETVSESMTVQTSNALATITPAEAGYFHISFEGGSTGLTVSADMLREVWGIVYKPNTTTRVNTNQRAQEVQAQQARRIEQIEEREFSERHRMPKELTFAARRAKFAQALRAEEARPQVIGSEDSDSDSEDEVKLSTTSTVKSAVQKLGPSPFRVVKF